ncbi:MAG: DUF262 domain-containing protein [Erysipelotrichaceae bacterium]|nr:DUF262 domain-containing protein [Erysipelotrichaceae bacterium]
MLVKSNSISPKYVNLYSLRDQEIVIPIFQRFYDWKEKQVDALLDDLLSCKDDFSKQIYLMDLAYYSENNQIILADGQQRVVTINLLIKTINDYIANNHLNIERVEGFNIKYDIPQYQHKYTNTFDNYPIAPFKKNYLYFHNWVNDNKDYIEDIIKAIKENIYVFTKETENLEDAFLLFQQINTGGKILTKEEVIKSTIDQFAVIYHIPVNAPVKELKKMILSYYKYLYSSSANDFDTISVMAFLRNDVVSTREKFQKFATTLDVINNLTSNPMTSVINYINRPQLFDILNIMGMEGIDVFARRNYLNYVMFPLCLLSISMTMKKANPGGIIKTLYSGIIDKVKQGKNEMDIGAFISSFINDNPEICKINYSMFEKCLGDVDLKQGVKKAILIIDVIMNNTSSTVNVDAINLEHIYPQKPDSQWATENWPTNYDEQRELIHNIGNYLLLNEEVNKRIKNKYIDYKVIEYNRIIPQDLSLGTEMNKVDFNRFKNERKSYIEYRQKEIAKLVFENFKLAQVIIVDDRTHE